MLFLKRIRRLCGGELSCVLVPPNPMSSIFNTEFRPGWGDVDQDRVLHFPIDFRHLKDSEVQFCHSLGIYA